MAVSARGIEKALRWGVFAVFAITCLFQVISCRGIYADGANLITIILDTQRIQTYDPHRWISMFWEEFPMVLALKAGVTNLVMLRYFYSSWTLIFLFLVWGAALYELRGEVMFWPFLLFFCFVYFNTGFFAHSEATLSYALTACGLRAFCARDRAAFSIVRCCFSWRFCIRLNTPRRFCSALFCWRSRLRSGGPSPMTGAIIIGPRS